MSEDAVAWFASMLAKSSFLCHFSSLFAVQRQEELYCLFAREGGEIARWLLPFILATQPFYGYLRNTLLFSHKLAAKLFDEGLDDFLCPDSYVG